MTLDFFITNLQDKTSVSQSLYSLQSCRVVYMTKDTTI